SGSDGSGTTTTSQSQPSSGSSTTTQSQPSSGSSTTTTSRGGSTEQPSSTSSSRPTRGSSSTGGTTSQPSSSSPDESQTTSPTPGLLHNLRATDNHPPLYFLILWLTVRAFGYGQLAVHIPTIVAGTLLIPVVYITGCELFDRRTGAFAALLTAIAPLLVWYSQE